MATDRANYTPEELDKEIQNPTEVSPYYLAGLVFARDLFAHHVCNVDEVVEQPDEVMTPGALEPAEPYHGDGVPNTVLHDLRAIMAALGIDDYARPYSPHEVVQREVLPAIERLRSAPPVEPAPQPNVIDAAHIARQHEWSQRTFGPKQRVEGVLDHLGKELVEVAAAPDDVSEWADVVILGIDGACRAGHSPQTIIDAIHAKQARNETRDWPDWRGLPDDKAIEHVRAAPPVEQPPPRPRTCLCEVTEHATDCPSWGLEQPPTQKIIETDRWGL